MKKLIIFVMLLSVLSVQAFAEGVSDDGSTSSSDPITVSEDGSSVFGSAPVVTVPTLQNSSPVYNVVDLRSAPVSLFSVRSSVLKELITSIFGSYEPVTQETVIIETIDGETVESTIRTIVPGLAGVDFEWIGSVLLFGIVLLCFGKMLGGIVK